MTTNEQIEAIYLCTPVQQGMIFHTLLAPESGIYFEQTIYKLEGVRDAEEFVRCCQQLADRHSVLRTAFAWENIEKIFQVVFREASLPLDLRDWRGVPESEHLNKLDAYLDENERTGFDISQAPLARLSLLQTGPEEYFFIWSHHHALLDGWSTAILLKELLSLYSAVRKNQKPHLPYTRPFRDYIAWLQRQDMADSEAHWTEVLSGFTDPTPLPPGKTTTGNGEFECSRNVIRVQLDREATDEIVNFTRSSHLTLSALLMGAWALLLGRYSFQSDVVFGATVSGRSPELPGAQDMVGLLINTVPVRARIDREEKVIPWLARIQQDQALAREYDYVGLVNIQGWSQVPQGIPLFESLFVFENYPVPEMDYEEGRDGFRAVQIFRKEKVNYPISIEVFNLNGLQLILTYDDRRFEAACMSRVVQRLSMIIQGMAKGADRRLKEIPMITSEEAQLVTAWNATAAVHATSWLCQPGVYPDIMPLGQPLANIRIYILDEYMQPVPPDLTGNIYIGGAGVARGYLNQRELTEERFIKDPFSCAAGAQMYKTGDLGRWLADGTVEYLGRNDGKTGVFQSGLGEIEAALLEHAAVEYYADARLQGREVSSKDLREYLKTRLPGYMLPAFVERMNELTMTPDGKLNRRGVSAQSQENLELLEGRGLRNAYEEIVSGIFASVLKLKGARAEDSFFELGGHSLLATQVVSRVRSVFNVELSLRSLFEAPTVAGLAERVRELQGRGQRRIPKIERVAREGNLPLSFAQQRLWFVDQLEPESRAYHVPFGVKLRGKLDVRAVERSLSEIVRRHEVLRTSFAERDGVPVQEIEEPRELKLEVVEVEGEEREEGEKEREQQVMELAREEWGIRFDLGRGPLLRVKLLRVREEEHVLLLTMHHVVSDGWSVGVLSREFTALYNAYSQGEESPLEELGVQYVDFAVWQRKWLEGEVLEEQLSYWRKQLEGLETLELPTDHRRGRAGERRGGRVKVRYEKKRVEEWKGLSRREGGTLFMTLLGGMQAVLGRYTGQRDIAVGSDVANRNRLETEGLIGFFVNQLVLRSQLGEKESFQEVLRKAREASLGAYAHQDLPFERLVEELAPERELGRTPLFQVKLVLQNAPGAELRMAGVKMEALEGEGQEAQFDLLLTLGEEDGGIVGTLGYAAGLFEAETMERLARHIGNLLDGAAQDAERSWEELPLLSAEEQQEILAQGCGEEDNGEVENVMELVERQVASVPDTVAVSFGQHHLSYGELNDRAERLAGYLRRMGIGEEVLVGLCMERSIEMVVGMLGVLKAGGAYVPLDPHYPFERLAYILDDAKTPLLLTQEHLRRRLPAHWAQVVCLDSEWKQIEQESGKKRDLEIDPRSLAYAIYTSGSTGRPKGTLISHEGLGHSTAARLAYYREPGEAYLLLPSFAFDSSVAGIYGALSSGGRLVLLPEGVQRDVAEIAEIICREQITQVLTLGSLYGLLLEQEEKGERLASLKVVTVAGEACQGAMVKQHGKRMGEGVELHNEYGPTEATVWSTVYQCTEADSGNRVPIGRPIRNTKVYVLDEEGEVVPLGVAGELYIGGAGVGRGYLERPELTGERFVPDGKSGEKGGRLYRTGDKARWRWDGNLEYLGRVDQQVKIRGYRIEPGEIESVLQQQGGVKQSVVVAVGEESGMPQRLVAYVVGEGKTEELLEHVRGQLPEYMVPAAVVWLEELPLTPNGKVDRKALPSPESREEERGERKPGTAIEEIIAGIWCEVLKVERVGLGENFFQKGGHSLLATQVVSRLRSVFGVDVPLWVLFEHATVEGLAVQVELLRGEGRKEKPGIERVAREGNLPLSFAQQRLWFVDQLEPESRAYHVPFGVKLRGKLDVRAVERSLSEIVRRHEVLRTSFPERDGVPVQEIEEPRELKLEVVEVEGEEREGGEKEREQQVMELAREEWGRRFDLGRGPLLRVKLLRVREEEHVLLLTMHHVVSDGWSVGVLSREFTALYNAYSQGEESPLEELGVQYVDFAVWQRKWLEGEVLEEQLSYWRKQLEGLEILELPTDFPRSASFRHSGAREIFETEPDLSGKLIVLCQREGVNLFMALVASFQVALGCYTGQDDIAIGTDIANRNQLETENLIGFFVNQLVLRTDLSANPTFRQVLARVRRMILEAHEHQDLPFDKLVEDLSPARGPGETPFFRVKLVLQNIPMPDFTLPGLTVSFLDINDAAPKFDILFNVMETGEGLRGSLDYDSDLFSAVSIRGFLNFYHAVLTVVTEDNELLDAPREKLVWAIEQKAYGLMKQLAPVLVTSLPRQRVGQTF